MQTMQIAHPPLRQCFLVFLSEFPDLFPTALACLNDVSFVDTQKSVSLLLNMVSKTPLKTTFGIPSYIIG